MAPSSPMKGPTTSSRKKSGGRSASRSRSPSPTKAADSTAKTTKAAANSGFKPKKKKTSAPPDPNSLQVKAAKFLLSIAHFNDKPWFPLLLISVSILNSLTAGSLVWCVGLLQATLFGMVSLTPRYRFFNLISIPGYIIGPLCLACGATTAAISYMRLIESESAEYVLRITGALESKWLETVRSTAQEYGALGLFGLQVAPVPIPTALIVVAGKLAGIDELTIFVVVVGSKVCQLFLSAQVLLMQLDKDGDTTVEGYLRKQFKDSFGIELEEEDSSSSSSSLKNREKKKNT